MSTDPRLIELAARLDTTLKRIERLETLEGETVTFPGGGGGPVLICDVVLGAPAGSVTLCPGPIPQGFRHLWAIVAASTTANKLGNNQIELNINGDFSANYHWYARKERFGGVPVGATDSEALSPVTTVFDTKIGLGFVSAAFLSAVGGLAHIDRSAMHIFIPDYTEATMFQYVGWYSYAVQEETFIDQDGNVFPGRIVIEQGGGQRGSFAIIGSAVTSLTLTHPGAAVFTAGSQFTLYGL